MLHFILSNESYISMIDLIFVRYYREKFEELLEYGNPKEIEDFITLEFVNIYDFRFTINKIDNIAAIINLLIKYKIRYDINKNVVAEIFQDEELLLAMRRDSILSGENLIINQMENSGYVNDNYLNYKKFKLLPSEMNNTYNLGDPIEELLHFVYYDFEDFDCFVELLQLVYSMNNNNYDFYSMLYQRHNESAKYIITNSYIKGKIMPNWLFKNKLVVDYDTFCKWLPMMNKKNLFSDLLIDGNLEILEKFYTDDVIIKKFDKLNNKIIIANDDKILLKLINLGIKLSILSFRRIKDYSILPKLKEYVPDLLIEAFLCDNDELLYYLAFYNYLSKDLKQWPIIKIINSFNCFDMLYNLIPDTFSYNEFKTPIFAQGRYETLKILYKMKVWEEYVADTFQEA